jgi:hypothetical protein
MNNYKTGKVITSKWTPPKNLSANDEAKERFFSAETFRDAALFLYNRACLNSLDTETSVRLMFVSITNQAFGIEQALKSLLYLEQGKHITGHDLKVLFDKVSESGQMRITEIYDEKRRTEQFLIDQAESLKVYGIKLDLPSVLEAGRNAFEKFRYSYDSYKLPNYNLGPFASAVHRYILELQPDWEVLISDQSEARYPHAFFGKRQS